LAIMNEFRFGVSMRQVDQDWARKCRRAEELSYDVITIPDHLGKGLPAPFPAMVSAAAATERVRVGTLVLNVPFYNPAVLARDIEATVRITDGRFDLGVGSGHMKSEFDKAGLPWWPASKRIEYLDSTLAELRGLLDEQPPLLIAGNSDGVLTLAAKHADIVGFAGLKQARGKPPGTFTLAGMDELGERVRFVREHAGKRADEIEHNMLIQQVVVAEDPRPALEAWGAPDLSADEVLETPQVLAGTLDQIVERVLALRERFGFTYFTVFEPFMETFAPVIAALRGR
jgi:probable F420-dependent oxidoreductase